MGIYRVSRNIEASIKQKIEDILTASGFNVTVELSFARIYEIKLPSVCIRVSDTDHTRAEIGDNATIRDVQVLVDIFAGDDGLRLDLKDCIIEGIRNGIDYYEHTITNGSVNKVQNGHLRVSTLTDSIVNVNTDKNDLDVHDRHRHLIEFSVSLGKIEV